MTMRVAPLAASFPLDNRLTVVLFAGMGGGCDGLEWAGFPVHIAINHDPVAVAVHEYRHPHTRHLRCDVFEADPRAVCRGREVRVLHASPDCTHFSVAKGGKPVSKRRRSLAWVVIRWAGTVRPETITLENVSEIQTWGPLIAKRDPATGRVVRLDGSVAAKGERVPVDEQWLAPDPRRRGRIWRAWLRHLDRLGYSFEGRVLVCADYGVPTIRKRFFGIAKADGSAIDWPARTHAPRDKAAALGLSPWVGAHTCIDWSIPMKSIFDRPKPLAEATLRRTATGVVRYVIDDPDPFIVPIGALTAGGSGKAGIVAAHLVQTGYGERAGQAPRALDIGEPMGTQVAGGGKAALVAAFMAQYSAGTNAGHPAHHMLDPMSTIATKGSQQALGAVSLGRMRGSDVAGQDLRVPVPALTAGGSHAHLILSFLQTYYSSGGQDQRADDPLRAVTAKARHGLVTVEVKGEIRIIDDVLLRMLEPEEGARAHGFRDGVFPEFITIGSKTRRLTKTEKYHLVGNSVPPRMVQLLAECNVRRELVAEAAE